MASVKSIKQRLERTMKVGRMTVSDLSRFFERPYPTVRSWALFDVEPHGPDGEEAYRVLDLLERAIENNRRFPVPLGMSKAQRCTYITKARHELDPRISQ